MNRALLAAGLVDRLEIMIFPVVTGLTAHCRSFRECPTSTSSVDSRLYDGRIQQVRVRAEPALGARVESVVSSPGRRSRSVTSAAP